MTNYKIISAIRNEVASRLDIDSLQKILASHWKPYLENLHVCMTDATCYESHMRFPTDMKLLWESIEWLYRHICMHCGKLGIRRPRNKYTDIAASYLSYCKKRKRKASRTRMLKRCMISLLEKLIIQRDDIHREHGSSLRYTQDYQKRLSIIRKVLVQEKELFEGRKISDRIVCIDRHYVHPIVRGKETKSVEFGAKVNNIQIDGISFIEHVSFKAFNEGIRLKDCIRMHQKLMNVRVRCVAADSIYANNANRKFCTRYGISTSFVRKARAAKEELVELQNRFDLLYDLDEDEQGSIEDKVNKGTAKQVGGEKKVDKKNLVKAFVNIVKAGFLHREADEADVEVYKNALTSDTTAGSEGEVGIGVTIPEDIRTDIIELRRSSDNLEQYVNVEGVVTKTGTRNIEVDAESTPFDNVDEAADFPEMDEPEFLPIEYKVKKKGGILKMTAELLEDTAANIMAYINKWIAKKTKATRNAMILKVLNEMTKGKEVTVENLDSLKDIFNEQLDPAIAESSIVITNQSGFNYLDKLKDEDGNYILQKDPTQQTKGKMLFGEYRIVNCQRKRSSLHRL